MGFASVILCSIFLVISFMSQKGKFINPCVFFFCLWDFILFLSTLNLYEIKIPSNRAYFFIDLMLFFFFVGMVVRSSFKKKISLSKCKISHSTTTINFKLYYILTAISILFLAKDCFLMIQGVQEGIPLWQLRNWTLEPSGSNNPILSMRSFAEEILRSVIIGPFGNITTPIVCYYFFQKKGDKNRLPIFIIAVFQLVGSSLAGGGGRLGFLCFCMAFLLAYLLVSQRHLAPYRIIKKYKRYILFVTAISFLFVIGNSALRNGAGNFMKEVYTYFALSPTLLSIWLENLSNIPHTYGLLTFFGFHSYFFRGFEAIGAGFLVPDIYRHSYQMLLNAERFLDVGYGVANAFVSPVYYFYIDGGIIGICIFSFLFGVLVTDFYNRYSALKFIDCKHFTLYYLVMQGVFYTFMRIQTCIPSYIISFVFCHLIMKKEKAHESSCCRHDF